MLGAIASHYVASGGGGGLTLVGSAGDETGFVYDSQADLGAGFYTSIAFTVNANTTVAAVGIKAGGAGLVAGEEVGIASDWTGSATVPWIQKATIAASGSANSWVTITLDAPASLVTGTTYRLATKGASGAVSCRNAQTTKTGIVSSYYPGARYSTYTDMGSTGPIFRLYS